jgi:hypothetical protein
MYRLGFTETSLLFIYYLNLFKVDKKVYINAESRLINWLYTTSGFYDKTIIGNYFDFNSTYVINSEIYKKYFTKLLEIVKNTDYKLQLAFHNLDEKLKPYKEDFLKYINYYNKSKSYKNVLDFMSNKHVLIINSYSSLMKKQYDSGNIKKICPEFPDIKSLQIFENGYTFFNNGPDNNILETVEKLCMHIKEYDFDGAIISAGAYSCLFADYIENNLKKDIFIIGGDLPLYFGIETKRIQKFNKDKINEYFIKVPDNMKPKDYIKIEDGCYW